MDLSTRIEFYSEAYAKEIEEDLMAIELKINQFLIYIIYDLQFAAVMQ